MIDAKPVQARELLEKYGTQLSQKLLQDMLCDARTSEEKTKVENAIEDLEILVLTDEKGLFLSGTANLDPQLQRLPPMYQKNDMEVWLFDDAFVSYHKLSNHYHGYRKAGTGTVRISPSELKQYRAYIDNPQSLLNF